MNMATKQKNAKLAKRRGPNTKLTAGEVRKIGVKANEMKAAGASVEERVETARRMRNDILTDEKRVAKVERTRALHNNGYTIQEIAKTLGIAESTVRKYLASDDEHITLHSLSTLTLRIREYKREGLSNVAIGQRVGVSESTVRRRLKTPLTEEETLLEGMLDELSNTRDEIIENIMHHPMFSRVFKDDGNWILRTNTIKRHASFTRREGRGHRMSFTLEFSAYRQPTKD